MSEKKEQISITRAISNSANGEYEDYELGVSNKDDKFNLKDGNGDIALQYAQDNEGFVMDPIYERKLLWKIDWMLIPLLGLLQAMQLLDKTTNSYSAIMGLREDLNMTSRQYSWVGSTFYFGYLFFTYPANIMLQKFPLVKTISSAVIIWGVIVMCHAACKTPATFLLCRFLLGMFESFLNAGFIVITSNFWTMSEQGLRANLWFGLQGIGNWMGAGIAHGLATNRTGHHDFSSWRLLHIIAGIITVVLGAVTMIHVPDIPTKAWFLNETDKKYVVERIRGNQQGFGNKHYKIYQVWETLKDPATYMAFLYAFTYATANGSFTNFGSILLNQDFGFSKTTSLLMGMPGGALDMFYPPFLSYMCYKFLKNQRLVGCIITNAITIIGMSLLNFTNHKGSRLAGYYTFYITTGVMSGMISIVSSNVAGRTKKATVTTLFFIGYCAGNICGPQTFKGSEAPNYHSAKATLLASYIIGTLCILGLFFLYRFRNSSRDEKKQALGDKYVVPENVEFADLTDRENSEFRYSL